MARIGAIGGLGAAAALMALSMASEDAGMRIAVDDIAPRRPRNYDIEGPKDFGPPAPPQPLTRQQRRWQDRQNKKRGR